MPGRNYLTSLIASIGVTLLAGLISLAPAQADYEYAQTAGTAQPVGIVVNTLSDADDGSCSPAACTLRDAINAANAAGGPTTITFVSTVSGTILLTSTLPAINNDVTIDGAEQPITVSGKSAVQVMTVTANSTLRLQSITIANGNNACGVGGGIYNAGTLIVTKSTFTGNTTYCGGGIEHPGGGSGIYNTGTLIVIDSTFAGNYCNDSFYSGTGGGIYSSGTLTVTNSTFSVNYAFVGGGINNSGVLAVISSTFTGNRAPDSGGIDNSGIATVISSTFTGNHSSYYAGAINNIGNMTVTDSTLTGNTSAYFCNPCLGGIGGGISNGGALTIINSTLSDNSAAIRGGGINNEGTLTIINSTFSGNYVADITGLIGGGGGINNGGALTMTNTIFAKSTISGDCTSSGTVTGGHNLISDTVNACGLSNGVDSNIIGFDPLLGPLADNGGSTLTMAPQPGSPAINAGDNAHGVCPAFDQRGVARPQGGVCDIGAVESLIWPRARMIVVVRQA